VNQAESRTTKPTFSDDKSDRLKHRVYDRTLTHMNITVDYHQFSAAHQGSDPASALLEWLRNSPDRSRIHVFLQPPRFDATARKLQYALQSLGCTVTRRLPKMEQAA
jgi:hypothetical protein